MTLTAPLPAWDLPPGGAVPPREAERLYQQFRERLLDEVYALPDQTTEAGWLRLHHHDLLGRTPEHVRRERRQLQSRLVLDNRPAPWLLERLGRLDAALRARTQS